jgi:hypothetical protein
MIPTAPRPDALFLRESLKKGRTQYERISSVCDVAEPILGVDRSRGERAYIRRQPGGWLFITRDPEDTIYHPLDSPIRGRDRYAWMARPDGSRWGYLTEEARRARRKGQEEA